MAIVLKSGSLILLEFSGPLQACNGTDLPFFFQIFVITYDFYSNVFLFPSDLFSFLIDFCVCLLLSSIQFEVHWGTIALVRDFVICH